MYCANCMTAMERQPLGNWYKMCACQAKAYLTPHAPLPKDAKIFQDLTGRRNFAAPPGRPLYRYGPDAQAAAKV